MEFLIYVVSSDGVAFHRRMVTEAVRFPRLCMAFYHAGIKASTNMIERYLADANADDRLNVPLPVISAEDFIGMLRGDIYLLHVGKPPGRDQLRRYVAVTTNCFLTMHCIGGTLPDVKAYRTNQALGRSNRDPAT